MGTEVSSPNYSGLHSTPINSTAIYKTNYGEVIYDEASPSLQRFIDTTSRVNIISYKSTFVNIPGTSEPTFTMQVYESTSANGPWLKSTTGIESNSIFLFNSKPYVKFELEIFSEIEDISTLGLLLYINVTIDDPSSPVISDYARNSLRKFPTWMDIYQDSIEQATPELATPNTVGGKFINALVGNDLDSFDSQLDGINLNSFLSTANEDIPAWGYVSYGIPAAGLSFLGDSIKLAKASSLSSLRGSRVSDYIYYHNLIDSQIITLRKYNVLKIDNIFYSQEPTLLFNIFDEFGARVGLKRLYLEENSNFKKRILDTYINIPSVTIEGLKRTLRRELDIWRAYGATPDSNYQGATPEILEIVDIESSTPYFSDIGNPEKSFYDFVKNINETYPSNAGYVKWEEGIWDYAGLANEGVDYIPFVYDNATPLGDFYQPGVGDFEDLKIEIQRKDSATVSFDGYFKASGFKTESIEDVYSSINIGYSYRAQYNRVNPDPYVSNPDSATPFNGGVAITYEIAMEPHNQYATPALYYVNLSYKDSPESFYVYNYYPPGHSTSPEFNYIQIVDSDGFTRQDLIFREKTWGYQYTNSLATPNSSSIDISKAESIKIVSKVRWDQSLQIYVQVPTGEYRVAFNDATPAYSYQPSIESYISKTTPDINYINSNFKIGSTVYGNKDTVNYSNIVEDIFILNKDNNPDTTSDEIVYVSDLTKNLLLSTDATSPRYLIIDNKKVNPHPVFSESEIFREPGQPIETAQFSPYEYGGESYYPMLDTRYFVPASPNILINIYSENDPTPLSSAYFESATFNYDSLPYTLEISNNFSSTPNYPFKNPIWAKIGDDELRTTPMIKGYIDYLDNVYKRSENLIEFNSPFGLNQRDTFLDTYSISREDFGLSTPLNNSYLITEIEPVSLNKKITLEASNQEVLRADSSLLLFNNNSAKAIREIYDSISNSYYFSPIDIHAKRNIESKNINIDDPNSITVNTGWLNLRNNDYYVYAKPIIESYSGNYFELDLIDSPRHGAPVIVSIKDGDFVYKLEEMAFPDIATPSVPSFYNEEILIGSNNRALYVSYLDIKDITIKDNFTGKTLTVSPLNPQYYVWAISSGDATPETLGLIPLYGEGEFLLSQSADYIISGTDQYTHSGNKIEIYTNAATGDSIIIPGREYTVSYILAKAFYVDRNVYSSENLDYSSKIYFSATPSATASYQIIYESAIMEGATPVGIDLGSSEIPLEEGYIYVTEEEYDFSTAVVEISPQYISRNIDDLIYLSITSYDVAGNLKPYQSFRISSDILAMEDEYITTNKFGYVKTRLRFTGIPTVEMYASIVVSGISYPQEFSHINSEAGEFLFGTNIEFAENYAPDYSLKAIASKISIEADGISENYINGYINRHNIPIGSTPVIYWKKGRSYKEIFTDVGYAIEASTPGRNINSGYVHASPDGRFSVGPFYSQVRNDPGYWLVALDTELAATPSSTPNSTYGDIAYWYERFDNVQYLDEETVLPSYYKNIGIDLDIIATPTFTYNLIDQEYVTQSSGKLNWVPPNWVPINYYDQYQMGFFGSTPNLIATPNSRIGYEGM